jgi:hypothetical protein
MDPPHNLRAADVMRSITLTVTMPAAFGFRVWLASRLMRAAAFVLGMRISILTVTP